ncbi:MAG: type II toxin-antitoxin system prevent-host-death family antitoxin, partial [candidate division NC10 bacterium]|nr:type II toxin-antitoxin system prevent-host-death family antitoxin [candidate division NC10 bacterium]
MIIVSVKELKNRLTQHLRWVKQGEDLLITERGKPIAVIQPIRNTAPGMGLDARLAKLAARGLLTLPTRKPLKN